MTLLNLRHRGKSIGVVFPTTVNAVNKAVIELKRGYDPAGAVRITDADSPIQNLVKYITCAKPENEADIRKLNDLAARIDEMGQREQHIFSGALDAESPSSLDDILRIADGLDQYELIDTVASDRELGGWLVENGRLGADVPESLRPYLDYAAIGAEPLGAHGGAYTVNGYVKRREPSQEQSAEQRQAQITLYLRTQETDKTMSQPYRLRLPATDDELYRAKAKLNVDYFEQASIVRIEFGIPSLEGVIPQNCLCVEDANELAEYIEEMMETDGELLKFMAVLCVTQPENLTDALRVAMDLDDYERITENAYGYGQQALRRIGADDEIIDTIDGYMDFEKFGEDSMAEDGVRRTEYGLVRCRSHPFPEETQGQQIGGM